MQAEEIAQGRSSSSIPLRRPDSGPSAISGGAAAADGAGASSSLASLASSAAATSLSAPNPGGQQQPRPRRFPSFRALFGHNVLHIELDSRTVRAVFLWSQEKHNNNVPPLLDAPLNERKRPSPFLDGSSTPFARQQNTASCR